MFTLTKHSKHDRTSSISIALLLSVSLLGLVPSAVHASNISACDDAIENANNKLTADLHVTVDGANCLTVPNGRNIDMNGKDIICDASGGCGIAIRANSSGTKVKNGDIYASGGGGNWDMAITGAQEVDNVDFGHCEQAIVDVNTSFAAVDWAKKIVNCEFLCAGSAEVACVEVELSRSSDEVSDNIFWSVSGTGGPYLLLEGRTGTGPTVEGNDFQDIVDQTAVEQVGAGKRFRAFDNELEVLPLLQDPAPTAFDIESTEMDEDRCDVTLWSGNLCNDSDYCAPGPDCDADCSCTNGGSCLCGPSGVYCTGP